LKIQLLNKIAAVGTDRFDRNIYTVGEDISGADAIMVRSAAMHDMEFEPTLAAIARAGAGVNNIPLDKCAEQGIVVFNTPGANANGVKELGVAALLLASRDIVGGIEWAKTLKGQEDAAKQVEKGKSKFAGCEIKGKTLGIIGLGAIGGMIANIADKLGMNVIGCDPYLSVDAAWRISSHVHKAVTFDEVFEQSDYISLHVPATPETKGMINAETIAKMKDGARIINLARADLVNAEDLIKAIEDKKIACYVTDFPTPEVIGVDGIIAIPHLGASTNESEDNCAVMAADELIDYLENGNITHSVNYPDVKVPRVGESRVCVLHKNIPTMLTQISAKISDLHINIDSMTSKARKDYAYTILDIEGKAEKEITESVMAIDGVIRVRVL